MDFEVGRALFPRRLYGLGGDLLAALLHLARDAEEGLELAGDSGVEVVAPDVVGEVGLFAQMRGGGGRVAGLAEVAVVAVGDVGGDEFAFAGGEGVGRLQEDLGELAHGFGGFGAEGEGGDDAGDAFRKIDMGHGFLS